MVSAKKIAFEFILLNWTHRLVCRGGFVKIFRLKAASKVFVVPCSDDTFMSVDKSYMP